MRGCRQQRAHRRVVIDDPPVCIEHEHAVADSSEDLLRRDRGDLRLGADPLGPPSQPRGHEEEHRGQVQLVATGFEQVAQHGADDGSEGSGERER